VWFTFTFSMGMTYEIYIWTFEILFIQIIEPSLREPYHNVTRWFSTLIHQKEFQAVLGSDYKLCEKAAQFDGNFKFWWLFIVSNTSSILAKKYAEVSQQASHPQARAKNLSQSSTDEAAKGEKKKGQEKPAKKEEAPKPAKKEKPAEQNDDEADDIDDVYANEPKQKDPFAEMPKTSFNMDEFKRVYSNEDTAEKAIPYFWQHFDKEQCSIWFCEYKFPQDLTQVFMTCNLVSGFFQRLDKLRKHAFASMCVFGENNNNTITGIWVWRGHELAFEVKEIFSYLLVNIYILNSAFIWLASWLRILYMEKIISWWWEN
jgi:elongation factor 1-gamma